MSLQLSAPDLARVESASRIMISPLASASVDDWRAAVNTAVSDLFRSHKIVFILPGHGDLYYSNDASDVVDTMRSYVELSASGDHVVKDPVVDLWHALRRQQRVEVFSWDINSRMIGQYGYSMTESEFTNLTVLDRGSRDFLGVYSNIPAGEVLLWILLEHGEVHPFGEHASLLLQALVPSFKAGLDALSRFDVHRQTLDAMQEALIVFGSSGGERHRNASFVRLFDAEPERDKLLVEVLRLSMAVHPFGAPMAGHLPSSPVAGPRRSIKTASAQYDLNATLLGPSAFDPDAAVMISVARKAPPALPAAGQLRERFGLTEREAEVALLLAEGLSNSDIADRLFLSPHTVRRHTANIFEKIGVSSRKALALQFMSE